MSADATEHRMANLRRRLLAHFGLVPMTSSELAYLSRAMFRQRMDKPEDDPMLAARLDSKVSVWRDRLRKASR